MLQGVAWPMMMTVFQQHPITMITRGNFDFVLKQLRRINC